MGKTPRLDKYQRLLSRFFEALVVLALLKRVQGPHVLQNQDSSTQLATRRRVLKKLSFLCDYKKGGESTTSIAVESRHDCNKFWISSNEGPSERVVKFLRRLISDVKRIVTLPEPQRQQAGAAMAQMCAQFASPRLNKETKMLSRMARKCRGYLQGDVEGIGNTEKTRLHTWLGKFENVPRQAYSMCLAVYESRNDPEVHLLHLLAREPSDGSALTEQSKAFRDTRHFVGRLAEHIRAPRQLLEDADRVSRLIDVYQVEAFTPPTCVDPPRADAHTTLDGILTRMLPKGDARLPELKHNLTRLDPQTNLEEAIRGVYAKETSRACVHCECQMLNHFYNNKLLFVDNDRFIACSKPACLCCKLYFRYHPARCEEPESHQTVSLNWGPVLLPKGHEDPGYTVQRDVLNRMIEDVRNAAFLQISQLQISKTYHPNSLTSITRSSDASYQSSDFEDEASGSDDASGPGSQHDDEGEEGAQESDPGSDTEGGAAL